MPLRAGMESHCVDEGLRSGEAELFSSGTGLCGDITNGGAVEHGGTADNGCPLRTSERGSRIDRVPPLPSGRFSSSCSDSISTRLRRPCPPGGAGRTRGCRVCAAERRLRHPGPPLGLFRFTGDHRRIQRMDAGARASFLDSRGRTSRMRSNFCRAGKVFAANCSRGWGAGTPAWTPPGKTPVEYLDSLGALDSRTLLVHAVHMTEADWALAAQRDCTVVFCPRSNRNLGSGRPWIEKALSLGISCALGTDSLASNTDLNLFAEAAFTLDNHPSIDPRKGDRNDYGQSRSIARPQGRFRQHRAGGESSYAGRHNPIRG